MTRVNIHEAKIHLSHYLKRVARGESILLCKRNVPVAEIRPLAQKAKPRPIGLDKGTFEIPSEFFDPQPQDLLDYFGGIHSRAKTCISDREFASG